MILSSSVGVGGGIQTGIMVTDEAGEDSVEVVVVVPSIVATVVVVGVGVIGLRGAAIPFVVSVLSVATGFGFLSGAFACWAFKWSLLL